MPTDEFGNSESALRIAKVRTAVVRGADPPTVVVQVVAASGDVSSFHLPLQDFVATVRSLALDAAALCAELEQHHIPPAGSRALVDTVYKFAAAMEGRGWPPLVVADALLTAGTNGLAYGAGADAAASVLRNQADRLDRAPGRLQ